MLRCGLLGETLGHSYSPMIHHELGEYDYRLFEVPKADLDAFLRSDRWDGLNVTIPYKKAVVPYCAELSEAAAKLQSVNTLIHRPDGTLYGDNTDLFGFLYMVRSSGIDPAGKKALVLGSGGASVTVKAALEQLGADVTVISRSGPDDYDHLDRHADAQIIANTTPVGMFPSDDGCPIDISLFHSLSGVIDVIYNPLSTRLVTEARKRGVPAEGGLYMLAAQAVCASALFLGKADSESSLDTALCDSVFRSVLAQKQNIVLIGMPSSGKSTVGARISELTGRELVDTDVLISEKTGRAITEIFATDGETAFRALEREAVAEVSRRSGIIIATGGGAVLDPRNVDKLKQNGVLFFLDRPLGLLCATADRPLSRDASALARRYEERYPVYTSVCDVRVPGEGSVNEVAELVLGGIQNENSRN